jgi:hypothetical protein
MEINNLYKADIIKKITAFYLNNKEFLDNNINEKSRTNKEFIYELLYKLNANHKPKLKSIDTSFSNENNLKLYRGICTETKEDMLTYVDNLLNGSEYIGNKASINGRGIYTATNYETAHKYANAKYDNNLVIELELYREAKTIKLEELNKIANLVKNIKLDNLNEYLNYIANDLGTLALILGYDAIIGIKDYVVILNRSKIIINDIKLNEEINKGGKRV